MLLAFFKYDFPVVLHRVRARKTRCCLHPVQGRVRPRERQGSVYTTSCLQPHRLLPIALPLKLTTAPALTKVTKLTRNTGYKPGHPRFVLSQLIDRDTPARTHTHAHTQPHNHARTHTKRPYVCRPNKYPEEFFKRFPVNGKVVNMVIDRLRSDDVYNMISIYPAPNHRSVALAQQVRAKMWCWEVECICAPVPSACACSRKAISPNTLLPRSPWVD